MVVVRLTGETIARKLLRDDRVGRRPAGDWDRRWRRPWRPIHALPVEGSGLRAADPLRQLRGLLDDRGEPHPAFELGLRWLEENRPPEAQPCVVHGDLRLGNLLVDDGGLRAVLDWELAHLGDPLEDLGWFCVRAWRFGSTLPAGGVATREELVQAYEAASGQPVDLGALRWWEVLGTLRWGVICIMQAWGHLSGAVRSVELASIGRRVCENEWDVLALLPGGSLPLPGSPAPAAAEPVHDRPTAIELLEAVREWVEGDVSDGTDPRLAFHGRVAGNVLRMVERELALEPSLTEAHRARLAELGCRDDRQLAEEIRGGGLDHRAAEVRAAVAASVHDKLLVANPGWLTPDA